MSCWVDIDAQIGRLYVAVLETRQPGRLYNQPYMSYWKPGNLGVSTSSGNHDFMIELSVTKPN